MYAGEMCYWFITSASDTTDAERAARNLGEEMLDTYIQATEQIQELQGWSNDQARKYLIEMKARWLVCICYMHIVWNKIHVQQFSTHPSINKCFIVETWNNIERIIE